MGLTLEEAVGPPFDVWPDNWPAFLVFEAMATQWRDGVNGRTGLDYACLPQVMDLVGIEQAQRGGVFEDVRVMEGAALRYFDHQRANAK